METFFKILGITVVVVFCLLAIVFICGIAHILLCAITYEAPPIDMYPYLLKWEDGKVGCSWYISDYAHDDFGNLMIENYYPAGGLGKYDSDKQVDKCILIPIGHYVIETRLCK